MASNQYTDEFKAEAVKQVTERGFAVAEVAKRHGVSPHSVYQWLREAFGTLASAAVVTELDA